MTSASGQVYEEIENPGYRLRYRYGDPVDYGLRAQQFSGQAVRLIKKTEAPYVEVRARAYLDLADFLEGFYGHHPLTFRMYERALALAESMKPGEKRQIIILTADQALKRLAESLLTSLEEMDTAIPAYFLLIPETEDVRVAPYPRENAAFEMRRARTLGVIDVVDGFVRCRGPQSFGKNEGYIPWREIGSIFLLPANMEIDIQSGSRLTWTLRMNTSLTLRSYSAEEKLVELEAFHARFPQFVQRVAPTLERRYYERAMEADSLQHLRDYAVRYPAGRYLSQVNERVESKSFETALQKTTIAALVEFLKEFPASQYRAEATLRIQEFQFREAMTSEQALTKFLEDNPDTPFLEAAEEALEGFALEAARRKNTLAAYGEFLRTYPSGKHRGMAEQAIRDLRAADAFGRARAARTKAAYQTFLREYPETSFSQEAQAMLAYFEATTEPSVAHCARFLDIYESLVDASALRPEYDAILGELRSLALTPQSSADAFLLLYGEEPREEYLLAGLQAVHTAAQEAAFLKRLGPARLAGIFRVTERTDSAELNPWSELSWPLARESRTIRPVLEGWLVSQARYGTYRVTVEYRLPIDYKRSYSGITWFNPDYESDTKYWSETYTASATAVVAPRSNQVPLRFEFPTIEMAKLPGYDFVVGYVTEGTPGTGEVRVVAVTLVN